MVFADAEEVDPDLIGEHALLDDASDRLCMCQRPAAPVVDQVAEGVETEDEREWHTRAVSRFALGPGVLGVHVDLRFRYGFRDASGTQLAALVGGPLPPIATPSRPTSLPNPSMYGST